MSEADPSLENELDDFLKTHKTVRLASVFTDGELVGDWRILGLLSRGGCGEVYRVVHETAGTVAALKVLFKDDEALRARFVLESDVLRSMAASDLEGAGAFPKCLESGVARDGRHPYVVIEELRDFALPETDEGVAAFLLKMCTALSALHANGFLHRDLKPANIMCRADGEPVIIDFGLARRIEKVNPLIERVSMTGGQLRGVGTIGSSAPEQAVGEATVRSDVYALGALANDCFHGNPPSVWGPIILGALDPKPEHRYASPAALAEAIRARRKGSGWRFMRQVAVVAALAGAALALVVSLRRPTQEAPSPQAPAARTAAALLEEGWDLFCGVNGKTFDATAAAACFREAAEMGCVTGRIEYAKRLLRGEGVPPDAAKAWEIFTAEALLDSEAQRMIGECLRDGLGVVQDKEAAFAAFRQASERGNAEATYNLALSYWRGEGVPRDWETGERYLAESAERGFVKGLVEFAGRRERSPEERTYLLKRAVKARVKARHDLSFAARAWALLGEDARDEAEIDRCFNKALAYQCDQPRLFFMYGRRMLPLNRAKAESLFNEAFRRGFRFATYSLYCLCVGAGGERREEAQKWADEAVAYFRPWLEKNDMLAYYALGTVLVLQAADDASVEEAVGLLQRAAAAGQPMAFYRLGRLCESGTHGVEKDEAAARVLFERAAALGCVEAKFALAQRLLAGSSPAADRTRAASLLREVVAYDTACFSPVESYGPETDIQQLQAKARGLLEELGAPCELQVGDVRRVALPGGAMLELVWCPPGRDVDGREIAGFWLGRTEVTQGQWESVMGNNPSRFEGRTSHPVEQVYWQDCKAFLEKCRGKGLDLCLPTAQEWSYACRAGGTGAWGLVAGGAEGTLDTMGWYGGNTGGKEGDGATHEVAQKTPNAWGLYDMHGNVWEWCADAVGDSHLARGGSWSNEAKYCTAEAWNKRESTYRHDHLGFRVAARGN